MVIHKNLHPLDRAARTIVGLGCTYAGFIDGGYIGNETICVLVGIFGLVNLGAALFSYCPVYQLAGISSCSGTK